MQKLITNYGYCKNIVLFVKIISTFIYVSADAYLEPLELWNAVDSACEKHRIHSQYIIIFYVLNITVY